MGSYAHCWLDDLLVGSNKNELDKDLISLFRESDKVIMQAPVAELPHALESYRESLEDDDELLLVFYKVPVHQARDRLAILGYDLKTAEAAFREWVDLERVHLEEMLAERERKSSDVSESLARSYRDDIDVLSKLTPDTWRSALSDIRESDLRPNYWGRYEGPHANSTQGYLLSNEWYGFPGYDLFVPLRLAMELFKDSDSLVYDVTDLIWSEYYEPDENLVEFGIQVPAEEYNFTTKTVVLTEGKTDAWILKRSLALLYPHLQDYYSFLDFDGTKFGGGVGNLVNAVKAFAGSGIANDVVALFDNDTAARAALKSLDISSLPTNISIRLLPELETLRSYPTIGPSGSVKMDVNGIASSIELYLGDDVLQLDDEESASIQWTGYDKGLKAYQGEVLDKSALHSRFETKLLNQNETPGREWDNLRAVFAVIFDAFREKKRKLICSRPSDYYGAM